MIYILNRWFKGQASKVPVLMAISPCTYSHKSLYLLAQVPALFSDKARRFRNALLMLLLVMLGTTGAWGQTDFSGVWYIANETNHDASINTHWYLVPGKDPKQLHYADAYFNNQYCEISGSGDYTGDNYGDSGKPFLITYQTSRHIHREQEETVSKNKISVPCGPADGKMTGNR